MCAPSAAEKEELLIIGAGSQARYAIDLADGVYRVAGLVDMEDTLPVGRTVNGVEVICRLSGLEGRFERQTRPRAIVCHGDVDAKKQAVELLAGLGFLFATLASPAAHVSRTSSVDEGSLVNPHACVMPNARVGRHVIIHSQAVIEHDNTVGDFCNVGPGVSLAGNVHVGDESYLGTGASARPGTSIGRRCIVGAGSVIIRDAPDESVVVGVPARFLRWNRPDKDDTEGR